MEEQLSPMLSALSAPGASRAAAGVQTQFRQPGQGPERRRVPWSLFGVQYVKREGVYTDEARALRAGDRGAERLGAARALSDAKRGAAAVPPLVAAARKTGLTSEASFREAGMTASLQRLSPFFVQAKALLAGYGLPLDQTFRELRVGLVEEKATRPGSACITRWAAGEIDTVVSLRRKDGRWYLGDYLRHAEQALAPPAGETAVSSEVPTVPPPDPTGP